MEKLPKKERRQSAMRDAAEHVRKSGIRQSERWAGHYAAKWEIEDDQTISEIADYMLTVHAHEGQIRPIKGPNRRGKRDAWHRFLTEELRKIEERRKTAPYTIKRRTIEEILNPAKKR